MRTTDAAQTVYELLVPLVDRRRVRAKRCSGSGVRTSSKAIPLRPRRYYLRSALLVQATAPDALAFQARLLAALNLMRAGLQETTRARSSSGC